MARKREGKCLSASYKNCHTHLSWMCDKGHVWKATFANIVQNTWCPRCAKSAANDGIRHTIEDAKKLAIEKNGECLSDTYSSLEKLLWKCNVHNCEWRCEIHYILRGNWCRQCANERLREKALKYSIEDAKNIAYERNGKCLSHAYKDVLSKLTWECCKGHIWQTTFASILGGTWCNDCSKSKSERICREFLEQIFDKQFPSTRAPWLGRLELDGYCEELGIAFEHQGDQHYEVVPIFKMSKESLEKIQERDCRKKRICDERGIKLIIIPQLFEKVRIADLKQFLEAELKRLNIRLPKGFHEKQINFNAAYSPNPPLPYVHSAS